MGNKCYKLVGDNLRSATTNDEKRYGKYSLKYGLNEWTEPKKGFIFCYAQEPTLGEINKIHFEHDHLRLFEAEYAGESQKRRYVLGGYGLRSLSARSWLNDYWDGFDVFCYTEVAGNTLLVKKLKLTKEIDIKGLKP